ncbi:MAG: polyprenyl synthetase family protein [Armatimonadetes bacterium]|nr:polyprenyl synthetase family protein [Armatimonadota bacterium]MDI9585087.1 polyprenyl synthetase family protein [Acidobacteriota bacterium]
MSANTGTQASHQAGSADSIKLVPSDLQVRLEVRTRAAEQAAPLVRDRPPARWELEQAAGAVLADLGLPPDFLGFAMVCVDNAFWHDAYSAVPFRRRLLLLPKCLNDPANCAAEIDSVGLHCAGCGCCEISGLKSEAEALGYQVVVAEGTSSVILKVLEGEADAILGVACLDSLEKSFEGIADLGIPHQAVPLLRDGCRDTEAEPDLVRALMTATAPAGEGVKHGYLPLLRHTADLFAPDALAELLAALPDLDAASMRPGHPLARTREIALDWLLLGGKRLRPFVTLAAYSVARHGDQALDVNADLEGLIPASVRQIAVAIEALHKASLAHDDIEDRDDFRYGEPALHRRHGTALAINVGDYLVGLGYRLVSAQACELGDACVSDILQRLSLAHLQLCNGQGADLLWQERGGEDLRPEDTLRIGALKTAPAFELALYAGLRPAGVDVPEDLLRRFATLVGEGYQVLNDLRDWEDEAKSRKGPAMDALAQRPTVLRAFALEAGGAEALRDAAASGDDIAQRVHKTYRELGAFDKAELLYRRLRERALDLCDSFEHPSLPALMRFLVRNLLPLRTARDRG